MGRRICRLGRCATWHHEGRRRASLGLRQRGQAKFLGHGSAASLPAGPGLFQHTGQRGQCHTVVTVAVHVALLKSVPS